MKNIFLLFFFILTEFFSAQSAADVAVKLSATVQNNPPEITLSWANNASSNQYSVFRKDKSQNFWGAAIATLPGSATQFVDNAVVAGDEYEYCVRRNGSNYTGYGYISSGITVPEVFYRGKVILVVDSAFILSLAAEIIRLITDMEGDGWDVIRHDVLRTSSVKHVKSLIVADYAIDSAAIKAVFLLGHVPVPYSGNINPDGHADHLGAWPADCYYADVDGIWTDLFVTSTTNSPPRTQNVPGDGKFDQNVVPSDLELQVGRVDFANLPAFTLIEEQLMKNYLDKDHDYRKKIFVPADQGVIDDNFGYFSGEAFAASGHKNLSALLGSSNVIAGDYFTSLSSQSYRWSYGCGGGSYTSASGIGTTANFAAANLQGVFTMLFGSYFGDWDSQNNFLRAALAQGRVLTNVWSGRPHYQFHHMGMGENIGYSLLMTQNNPGNVYFSSVTGITGRWVHNALMGDPTLRNHVVAPVANIVATKVGYDCHISWTASTETNLAGYNIYAKNDSLRSYVKLNQAPVAATTFTDYCLLYKGIYTYMVRAVKLEVSNSGSYYNMSEGLTDTAYNSSNIKTKASFMVSVQGNSINVLNTSVNGTASFWNFGNGQTSTLQNPESAFEENGTYTIMLVSGNGCHSDTAYQTVVITEVGLKEFLSANTFGCYPTLTHGVVTFYAESEQPLAVEVYSIRGECLISAKERRHNENLDLTELPPGVYMLRMRQAEKTGVVKVIRR